MNSEDGFEGQNYIGMNAREEEVWRCFLLAKYGYACMKCQKTLQILEGEDRIRRQKLIKPERQMPLLTIDHINGDPRIHTLPNGDLGGNLQLLCYSCNLKKRGIQSELPNLRTRDVSASILINRQKMSPYLNWIKERLNKFGHICYQEALTSGCKAVGIKSQITGERYIDLETGEENGLFDIDEFKCEIKKCDGRHIYFRGERPLQITDQEFIKTKEREKRFLQIEFDDKKQDVIDKIIDADIMRFNTPLPISTEQDVFSKMKLQEHVKDYYAIFPREMKYYASLSKEPFRRNEG